MNMRLKISAGIVLVLLAAGVLYSLRKYRTESLSPSELKWINRSQPKTVQEPGLRVSRATKEARQELLVTAFGLSQRTEDIPNSCKAAFWSSFTFPKGQEPGPIPMADPGQIFRFSDGWPPSNIPLRRLIFAGELAGGCFIYYERGGRIYPSSCLAVMNYKKGRAVWVGEKAGGWPARNLPELQRLLITGAFCDEGNLGC